MELTVEHICIARHSGACKSGLDGLKPGLEISTLPSNSLLWAESVFPQSIQRAIQRSIVGHAKTEILEDVLLSLIGGYGDGSGSGYGDGSSYGYGYGSGSGYGDGSGYGSGDGYGYGYSDGYGNSTN